MKKLIIFSLLITSSVFAYKRTGIDLGLRGGYREDKIVVKSTFDMPNTPSISFYDIKLEEMKSFKATGLVNLRFYGITLKGTTNYSWILSGNGNLIWPIMTGIENYFPDSPLDNLKGHLWDYFARAGYGIELYDSKFIVVPQIGYGSYNQNIKRPNISTESVIQTNFGIFPAILTYQVDASGHEFKTKWFGPHYGGDFIFDFKNNFEFEIGYFFHDLTYELDDEFIYFLSINFPSFGGVVDQQTNTEKVSMKDSGAYGHQIRGRVSYLLFSHWQIAAFGDYYYFKVSESKIKSDEEKIRSIGLPPLEINELTGESKAKRISYSLALELSFVF